MLTQETDYISWNRFIFPTIGSIITHAMSLPISLKHLAQAINIVIGQGKSEISQHGGNAGRTGYA